jgi:hypothetical protein
MPDLSTVPANWSVDRYAPSEFDNIGTYQGENNVLQISVDAAGDETNRGDNYAGNNYQGELTSISGGGGDDVAVLLYIPTSWEAGANAPDITADLWVDNANPYYAILGFTNQGTDNLTGTAYPGGTFEYWTDGSGPGSQEWTALTNVPVLYGQWNELDIQYTGTAFDYVINGVQVGSVDNLPEADDALSQVLIEDYNNGSPTNSDDYSADYANVTPEPSTFALIGLGLFGLAAAARKKARA